MYWGEIEIYEYMVRDYEKQVRDCAKEMDNYVKEFHKNVKYYNDKKENKMEAILINEIRQTLDAVKRTTENLTILKNTVVTAKRCVREMIVQGRWSADIKKAKNLTYFLGDDIATLTNTMDEVLDTVAELKDMLDAMHV